MKRIEIWLCALTIISVILEVFLIDGADALLGISLTAMAMLYYPFGFFIINSIPLTKIFKAESYKGISFLRGFGAVVSGACLSILLIGTMYKFLLLPGAQEMLSVGLISCSLILSVTLYKSLGNFRVKIYQQMLIRVVVFIAFGSLMYFMSGSQLVSFFYKDHPEYIKAYQEAVANPDNLELQKKLDEEYQKMGNEE